MGPAVLPALTLNHPQSQPYRWFQIFQEDNESLLLASEANKEHRYVLCVALVPDDRAWIRQCLHGMEGGGERENIVEFDEAINDQLPFADGFRDFAVRNLQPADYQPPASTGLEADYWRAKSLLLYDFPLDPHALVAEDIPLGLGGAPSVQLSQPAGVDSLAAEYDQFEISHRVSGRSRSTFATRERRAAHLDVVGRLNPVVGAAADGRRRVPASGTCLKLCRERRPRTSTEFYVVYLPTTPSLAMELLYLPDPAAKVRGSYTVEAE